MQARALLITSILLFFLAGYFFRGAINKNRGNESNLTQENPTEEVSSFKNNEITTSKSKKKILKNKSIVAKRNFKEIMDKGGQIFFHVVFDKEFWRDVTDFEIDELITGYNSLKANDEATDSHRDMEHKITRTKLGLLKSLGDFNLKRGMEENTRKKLVTFHKEILKNPNNIFIKRQAFSNLKKIIHFKSEKERDHFISGVDKRSAYLSEFSIDEIFSKVLNEDIQF